MPRCMMNTVRGYREGKYWGCEADNQNVMKTRSGRVISTVPKLRQSASANRTSVTASSTSTLPGKPSTTHKSAKVVDYKPMSCMSFVTRFGLIKEGIPLNFTAGDSDTDDWSDNPYCYPSRLDSASSGTSSISESESELSQDGEQWVDSLYRDLHPIVANDLDVSSKRSTPEVCKLAGFSYLYSENASDAKCKEQLKSLANDVSYIYLHIAKGTCPGEGAKSKVKHTTGVAPGATLQVKGIQVKPPPTNFKPSLAERHPVLLQCISRDDARDTASAAASLLSLASGRSSTTVPEMAASGIQPIQPKTTKHYIMYKTTPATITSTTTTTTTTNSSSTTTTITNIGVPQAIVSCTPNAAEHQEPSLGMTSELSMEEDDDSSSVASQSSADESYVRQASERDATFKQDLGRFQMESHAYAIDTSGNKIHRCTICDKVFTVISAFRVHVNTHVRPKNRCGVCGKIFSRSWLLKGHMRTHTGERPYTCRYAGCDRRFADKSNLRSHMLIHTTKDKGHICTKCKRAFAQKRYLHKHKLEVCKI